MCWKKDRLLCVLSWGVGTIIQGQNVGNTCIPSASLVQTWWGQKAFKATVWATELCLNANLERKFIRAMMV